MKCPVGRVCRSIQHLGTLTCRLQLARRAAQSAAFVGAEGNNGLALPVVLFEERIDGHWHVAPPVGIADEELLWISNVILWASMLHRNKQPWHRRPSGSRSL